MDRLPIRGQLSSAVVSNLLARGVGREIAQVKKAPFVLGLISILFVIIASYGLDTLPAEWFGDISIVHEYLLEILAGNAPFRFSESAGPLYHYLITPLIVAIGKSYLDYKIASVVVGLVGLFTVYLLARELASTGLALLTATVTSLSFWYIVWSRLGNSQIIIPLLTSLMVYFVLRYGHTKRVPFLVAGLFTSSLGLLVYPQTYILPGVFLVLLVYRFYQEGSIRENWTTISFSGLAFLPAALLFGYIVSQQPDAFTNGYIGSKLFGAQGMSLSEITERFVDNASKAALMLHLRGDATFRINVPSTPHLDVVSGALFFLGIVFWLQRSRRSYFPYILIPLLLLPLPSLAPALPPAEIPNSGRVLGTIPFVFVLVASGLMILYEAVKRLDRILVGRAVVGVLLLFIAYLNLHKYFVLYPQTLPNQNVPYGRIIADYINTFPADVAVHLTGCCWGEAGQAEPKGIYYALSHQVGREHIYRDSFLAECTQVDTTRETIVVFNPNDQPTIDRFRACFPDGEPQAHQSSDGQLVFVSLHLLPAQ